MTNGPSSGATDNEKSLRARLHLPSLSNPLFSAPSGIGSSAPCPRGVAAGGPYAATSNAAFRYGKIRVACWQFRVWLYVECATCTILLASYFTVDVGRV